MDHPFVLKDLAGRGRGLVANRLIRAGETILQEPPLLLAVASELQQNVCSYCLKMTAEGRYERLLSLAGAAAEEDYKVATTMHAFLVQTLGPQLSTAVSVEEVAHLIAKEHTNAYGIMAPSGPDGERRIRGGAIYWQASFINHECIPNVTRFDNFDSGLPTSTHAQFRALHDLPEGTELVQSYFPLNWNYEMRQQQCQTVYGFVCRCPRCLLEERGELGGSSDGSWQTDDGDEDEDADEGVMEPAAAATEVDNSEQLREMGGSPTRCSAADEDMSCSPPATLLPCTNQQGAAIGQPAPAAAEAEPLDPTYLQLFLLKYVCPMANCFGTMAPVLGSDVYECAVCGGTRTEQQFLAELQAAHGH